jgi:hypothetical protein
VWQEPYFSFKRILSKDTSVKKEISGSSPFQRKEVDMEGDPTNPFTSIGMYLTKKRLENEILFRNPNKLAEVIRFELEFMILPFLPEGIDLTSNWTDGTTTIFISIHVEEENHYSYSMNISESFPKN